MSRYSNSICIKCNNYICKAYSGTCRKYRVIRFVKKILGDRSYE